MLLFEHDAKELLAIQRVPVAGGIRLERVQGPEVTPSDEPSGPWVVKPQVLGGTPNLAAHVVTARSQAEISAAAASLLNAKIDGRTVHCVWIERKFESTAQTSLRFESDPPSGGIRISLGAVVEPSSNARTSNGDEQSINVMPDPIAVIAGVNRLAASLSGPAHDCIVEAGKMLSPLYFGYEATLMEIAPLMLLPDGGWIVGDVRLAIDEKALFRHPELLSLVERHETAYREVRERRRYGVYECPVDPSGTIAAVAAGIGHGSFLIDELRERGLSPYCLMEAGVSALNESEQAVSHILKRLDDTTSVRCLMASITGDMVDLPQVARHFSTALTESDSRPVPIVMRLIGEDADEAKTILQEAAPSILIEERLDLALDAVIEHTMEGVS